MPPADEKDGRAGLDSGTEGKTPPLPPLNQQTKLPATASHSGTGDKFQFVSKAGVNEQQETGINPAFSASSTAKERFSRHIQTITDREAARRQRSTKDHCQDAALHLEEGELANEVGPQYSSNILGWDKQYNLILPYKYKLRPRSHSADPSRRPHTRERGRQAALPVSPTHADNTMHWLGPITRGRARFHVGDSHTDLPFDHKFGSLSLSNTPYRNTDKRLFMDSLSNPGLRCDSASPTSGEEATRSAPDLERDSTQAIPHYNNNNNNSFGHNAGGDGDVTSDSHEEDFFTGEEDEGAGGEGVGPPSLQLPAQPTPSMTGTPPTPQTDPHLPYWADGDPHEDTCPDHSSNPSLHSDDHPNHENDDQNDENDGNDDNTSDVDHQNKIDHNKDKISGNDGGVYTTINPPIHVRPQTHEPEGTQVDPMDVNPIKDKIDDNQIHHNTSTDHNTLPPQVDPINLREGSDEEIFYNSPSSPFNNGVSFTPPLQGDTTHQAKNNPHSPYYSHPPSPTGTHRDGGDTPRHRRVGVQGIHDPGTSPFSAPHLLVPPHHTCTPRHRLFHSSSPDISSEGFPGDLSPISSNDGTREGFNYGPPHRDGCPQTHGDSLDLKQPHPGFTVDFNRTYYFPGWDPTISALSGSELSHPRNRNSPGHILQGQATPTPTPGDVGASQTLTHTLRPVPTLTSTGTQTISRHKNVSMGTQTDPMWTNRVISGGSPSTNWSPLGGSQNVAGDATHPVPAPQHVKSSLTTTSPRTHHECVTILQGDEDDSIMTIKSVDALVNQIRALMVDSSRFEVRAEHLHILNQDGLLTPWSMGVQPHPPFVQANPKLLAKIREVRQEAASNIQKLAEAEFDRQATKFDREGETLIGTLESMMQGKNASSLDERLTQTAAHVGKTKAFLQAKMEERRIHLANRQPTNADWDDYFHYSIAFRRNTDTKNQAFEVTPTDRAQADRDIDREIRAAAKEDSSDEEPSNRPLQQKRKRKNAPEAHRPSEPYRIPKKPQHRQNGREYRDNAPRRNNRDERDFGRSRPSQDHRASVYYNSTHHRASSRDGRDVSPTDRRREERGQHHQVRDSERDRKLSVLQRELDLLRRN